MSRSQSDLGALFRKRGTALPGAVPLGLQDEFAKDANKQAQWRGFIKKNRLEQLALRDVVGEIRAYLMDSFELARG